MVWSGPGLSTSRLSLAPWTVRSRPASTCSRSRCWIPTASTWQAPGARWPPTGDHHGLARPGGRQRHQLGRTGQGVLGRVSERAASLGITLAFAYLDELGDPRVKLHLDTYHMNIEE